MISIKDSACRSAECSRTSVEPMIMQALSQFILSKPAQFGNHTVIAAVRNETPENAVKRLAATNQLLLATLERQRQAIEKLRSHETDVASYTAAALPPGLLSVRRQPCSQDIKLRVATLTVRQRQIMECVLAGHPSKNIAADLWISQRTVENHRAAIMRKMGAASVAALVGLVLSAGYADAAAVVPGHETISISLQ